MKYTPWDLLNLMKGYDLDFGFPLHCGKFYHSRLRQLMNGITAPYSEQNVAEFMKHYEKDRPLHEERLRAKALIRDGCETTLEEKVETEMKAAPKALTEDGCETTLGEKVETEMKAAPDYAKTKIVLWCEPSEQEYRHTPPTAADLQANPDKILITLARYKEDFSVTSAASILKSYLCYSGKQGRKYHLRAILRDLNKKKFLEQLLREAKTHTHLDFLLHLYQKIEREFLPYEAAAQKATALFEKRRFQVGASTIDGILQQSNPIYFVHYHVIQHGSSSFWQSRLRTEVRYSLQGIVAVTRKTYGSLQTHKVPPRFAESLFRAATSYYSSQLPEPEDIQQLLAVFQDRGPLYLSQINFLAQLLIAKRGLIDSRIRLPNMKYVAETYRFLTGEPLDMSKLKIQLQPISP